MRRTRAHRFTAALVAAALATGVVTTTAAAAQAPSEAAGAPARPPVDNVFPVPMPYQVDFDDTWHACRDGCRRQHKGNDLLTDEGAPAVAVESGVIAKVDNTDDGLGGLTVWLRGDSGVAYYYAHNSVNLVAEGDRVVRGQMIARVGRTGNARTTPPHIHFQINVCGELDSTEPCTIDPYPYLQAWSQGMVDGGADAVGWYQPSTDAVGQRTEMGSPLPAFGFELPGGRGDDGVVPVAGDWDGDGRDSVGLYRRADATVHLRKDDGERYRPVDFGVPGRRDVWPLAGDFDGDGRDTIGLYAQQEATFVVMLAEGRESSAIQVGTPGDAGALPVVGDWDGDGRDSIGLYRRSDGALGRYDDGGRDEVGLLRRDTKTFELPGADPVAAAATATAAAAGTAPEADPAAAPADDPATDPTAAPAAVRSVRVNGGPDVLPVAGDWNGRDLVTLEELRQIYGAIPNEAKVVEGMPALNAAMLAAGISTPARKAAFLATIRSESGFLFDAVEAGNDSRYRGRGFIQLTGEANYRAAGEALGIDLVDKPDFAINGLASPVIAAWYWTMARNINVGADRLDMAAVNIAIGFEPSVRRDMMRCSDFIVALRYYSGGSTPPGVNCARTMESAMLAFMAAMPFGPSAGSGGAPTGVVSLPPGSIPEGWEPTTSSTAPADPATTAPGRRDPEARTTPPTASTTRPLPPSTSTTTAPTPSTTWTPPPSPSTTASGPSSTTTSPSTSSTSPSTSSSTSSSTTTSTSSSSTTMFSP